MFFHKATDSVTLKKDVFGRVLTLNKYPHDPFKDFGFFLLGNYEFIINNVPNSRLRSLALYSLAFSNIKNFLNENPFDKKVWDSGKQEILLNSRQLLLQYVKSYPTGGQLGNAIYLLSWINACVGNIQESMNWISKNCGATDFYINGRYYYKTYNNFLVDLLANAEIKNTLQFLPQINKLPEMNSEEESDSEEEYDFEYIGDCFDKNALHMAVLSRLSYPKALEIILNQPDKVQLQLLESYGWHQLHLFNFKNVRNLIDRIPSKKKNKNTLLLTKVLALVDSTLRSNDIKQFTKAAIKLRRQYNDLLLSHYILDYGIKKFPLETIGIDFAHYLKVVYFQNQDPIALKNQAELFLKLFPKSNFADDVLAELVLAYTQVLRSEKSAEEALSLLLKKYPRGNACDNALRWIALFYDEKMYESMYDNDVTKIEHYYNKALKIYNKIIAEYPLTRHRIFAEIQIKALKEGKKEYYKGTFI